MGDFPLTDPSGGYLDSFDPSTVTDTGTGGSWVDTNYTGSDTGSIDTSGSGQMSLPPPPEIGPAAIDFNQNPSFVTAPPDLSNDPSSQAYAVSGLTDQNTIPGFWDGTNVTAPSSSGGSNAPLGGSGKGSGSGTSIGRQTNIGNQNIYNSGPPTANPFRGGQAGGSTVPPLPGQTAQGGYVGSSLLPNKSSWVGLLILAVLALIFFRRMKF